MSLDTLKQPLQVRTLQRTYRTSGSLVIPDGVYLLRGLLVGAGGGGGGGGNPGGGGGGGSGWPIRFELPVLPGETYLIGIGTPGAGGAAAPSNGTAAGTGGDGGATTLTCPALSALPLVIAPGGGHGGGASGGATNTVSYGGASWDYPGTSYDPDSNSSGGGGGGYCGGRPGSNSGYPRIIGGRVEFSANSAVGYTNGLPSTYNKWAFLQNSATVAGTDPAWLVRVPERFMHLCWGGVNSTSVGAPPAQPPNTGHGGDGGGYGQRVAGGAGGSGLALLEWEQAA